MFKGPTANHCFGGCGGMMDTSCSNSSNTSGSTVGSILNFISPLLGSGGFYLYFGFFSTSPQDWLLDYHKVPQVPQIPTPHYREVLTTFCSVLPGRHTVI